MTARFTGLPQLTADPTPDAELLRRFAAGRDDAAFRELVRRHGRLVFGVCRRAVGDRHLAEDAFQAVFLVLATKAARVRDGEKLSAWLHGVAVRVGRRAQRSEQRRRWKAGLSFDPPAAGRTVDSDMVAAVDAEIDRLPEAYRVPLVLCELEGVPRSAAAKRLNLPEGTLSSRLAAGRKRLAANLARRGVVLSTTATLLAVEKVPAAAVEKTFDLISAGRVPPELSALAFGRSTMRTYLLAGASLVSAVGLVAVAQPPKPAEPPAPPAVKVTEGKPAEPRPAYTTKPKMRRTLDVNGSVESMYWSADGGRVAIYCRRPFSKEELTLDSVVIAVVDPPPDRPQILAVLGVPADRIVTDVRIDGDRIGVATLYDSGGQINSLRRAEVWQYDVPAAQKPAPPAVPAGPPAAEKTELERILAEELPPGDSAIPLFRGPGKNYWLLTAGSDRKKTAVTRLGLADVEVVADGPVKPPAGSPPTAGLTFKWFHADAPALTLYTIDSTGALMRHGPDKAGAVERVRYGTVPVADDYYTAVAPGGKKVAVATTLARVRGGKDGGLPKGFVYAPGAEPVPLKLQDLALEGLHGFSADGRLISGSGREYTTQQDRSQRLTYTFTQPTALIVWDSTTGERVKQWEGSAKTSFAPHKPLLAVAERLSERGTRIGFWDFSPPK